MIASDRWTDVGPEIKLRIPMDRNPCIIRKRARLDHPANPHERFRRTCQTANIPADPAPPMKADHATAVRSSRKTALAGTLIGGLMRVVGWTLRVKLIDHSGITNPADPLPPSILLLWHNRFFAVAPTWAKYCGRHRRTVALTSASKDGEMVERALGAFGMGAVRGSSSRRAVAALVGLKRAVESGCDVCITPDGPRGPRYQMQPGAVKLAQSTGAALQPLHVRFSRAWRLPTWDRYVIPVPFSRVEITFDHQIQVPRKLDEDSFGQILTTVQTLMIEAADDV